MTTGIRKTNNSENTVAHTEDKVGSGMTDNNQTQASDNGSTFAATTQSTTDSEHDTTHTTAPITALGGPQTETSIDLSRLETPLFAGEESRDPLEKIKQPPTRRLPRIYKGLAVGATCSVLLAATLGAVQNQSDAHFITPVSDHTQAQHTARSQSSPSAPAVHTAHTHKLYTIAAHKKKKSKQVASQQPARPTQTVQPTQPAQVVQVTTVPQQPVANAPIVVTQSSGYYQNMAVQAAENAGINPTYFTRQIQLESNFNPNAQSGAGAIGIAQFMPGTAASIGVNPYNPQASLNGAAQLMARLSHEFGGDYSKALAAYNTGEGTVINAEQRGGTQWLSEMPAGTQNYIHTIMAA
ncbi:lytic transglycosylase domain-containing protein [Ktedonobacteria bacterium brp13]|nr:lytic transglycosylase domain-containing protein [Ktedonobacteria bacterium brp13]